MNNISHPLQNESSVLATFKTVLVLPEYPGYGFSVGLASPETCLDSALIVSSSIVSRIKKSNVEP